jgi:Hemerythrin HHE cation binding domain
MTSERVPLNGKVDFTMMYVAHDAFSRDLNRMIVAGERGEAWTPETQAGWAMFTEQLHVHHTTEDTSLWPRLRAQPLGPDEADVLDQMEMEHAQLDPVLESIEKALAEHDAQQLVDGVHALAAGLSAHMRHEENQALPLIETYLGPAGWDAFGRDIRNSQGGLRGGARYLPWVLDGATPSMQAKVLELLPPPARILYRRVWAPKYRRTVHWGSGQA